jgi:hypothetical protein
VTGEEPVLRHTERPAPGTLVAYSLTPKGLHREEFVSGVRTHSLMVEYGEVWDTYRSQELPKPLLWRLLPATAAWFASLALRPNALLAAVTAALLAAAWVLLALHARVVTVRAFDYDGYEMAAFRGLPGSAFQAFLRAFDAHVASQRYPLQSVLESLDLGRFEVKSRRESWSCSFLYDRVVLKSRGWLGGERRVYYSLASIQAPLRLVWRLPWAAVALFAGSAFASLALASEAFVALDGLPAGILAALLAAGAASLAWAVFALGAAVEVPSGSRFFRTPVLPWWRARERRELLSWFARLIRLADLLAELETEDYWEYHRVKLGILKDEGFLGEWPYRSALARLNSQEREELGE